MRSLESYPATATPGWHWMRSLESYPAATTSGWHRMRSLESKLLRCRR
jgi:hypothetical protein